MKAISLQSGSNGNCIYVEAGGVKLLFDAGISGVQAEKRLANHGLDIRDIDALIISHDHADHIRCAGIYQRKYGLPLYITARTLEAALYSQALGRLTKVHNFTSGKTVFFGDVSVETVPTEHDGEDGSAFIIAYEGKRLGIFTDLGHVFMGLEESICTLDAVFIESNYDPRMLSEGPYPAFLKKRIQGAGGHLSNIEAAELLSSASTQLQWACLAHLSEQNNHPEIALKTHRAVNPNLVMHTAGRYGSTGILTV